MADPTPAPTPKTRKPRGPIDGRLLQQLETDTEIISSAVDEIGTDTALAAELATHFIDRDNTVPITLASLQALSVQATDAGHLAANATSATATFHTVTGTEGGDQATAIAAIRSVQARAKEKYEETDSARLAAYYVGQPLGSRVQITAAGTAVFTLLRTRDDAGNVITPQDTLPGFDQPKIEQLETDLGSYAGIQTTQSGAQSKASQNRQTFADACDQISRRRRKLQLAVDAERPYSDSANASLRTRLGLPPDKSMS